MPAHPWLSTLIHSPAIDKVATMLARQHRIAIQGNQGSSVSLLAGAIACRMNAPVLLLVAHLDDADEAISDLELFAGAGSPIAAERFGALEVLPGESSVSIEFLAERLGVVHKLVNQAWPPQVVSKPGTNQPAVIVASIQAVMQAVPDPALLDRLSLTLRVGLDYSPGKLGDWLTTAGYQRTDAIEQPGDFAVRGGIVDIYLPAGIDDGGGQDAAGSGAIRLDYFGDEIESIHRVDTDTLGSGRALTSIQVVGAQASLLQSDEHTTSLFKILPPDTIVVMHELLELTEQARGYYERLTNPRGIYPPNAVFKFVQERTYVEVNQFSGSDAESTVSLPVEPLIGFSNDGKQAVAELFEIGQRKDSSVVVLCPKDAERDRLNELIAEHIAEHPTSVDAAPSIHTETGYIHRGFIWSEPVSKASGEALPASDAAEPAPAPVPGRARRRKGKSKSESPDAPMQVLYIVSHQELFHRYHTRRRIRRILTTSSTGGAGTKTTDAFLDLSPGDYVVHVDHGVSRFNGLKTLKRDGKQEEYLNLEFADNATLNVPVTQIDLVQKYIGGFHGRPPLSMLGGKRWAKQKQQVEEAVKDLAAEMLRVQAARASMPGIRFPEDTAWQKEFEAEFPYEETEDQLAAIQQVKRDMSNPRPMDRLICGDVGFGKTEIAIRAAFKAAESGKQVAVLVPTTILAEQHERTFKARMGDYPIRIACMNRYRSPQEIRDTLEKVKRKQVDIIIGTHRILSDDVQFAELGLVIIDEEQRFGVEHKHKLMKFRMTVDVLTLSATPIPRTLHMSMLGLRDISSLTTPPMDRRATVTEVLGYDEKRIQRAMIRELNRDGQIFFVHNRVHNIEEIADNIQRLVPDAKIVIGHGQMPGYMLEDVMMKFIKREADILVSTTIIESGVDIPTANTMFINEADHFGLADLHQLRGRVGRYKHRAYCYLLLPQNRPVTDTAAQRLRAIEQYAMLGAGFKIAMRDLEIRGAGNLLGAEQSGHIATVGYEMYCSMLEEATRRLKQEQHVEPVKTHLELGVSSQIPKAWIASDKFRMEAYRRFARASTLDEFDAIAKDMVDAYGKPPAQAQVFIDLAEIRLGAGLFFVDAIKLEGPDLIFKTHQPKKLDAVLKDAPGRASVIDEKTIYYRPPPNYLEQATMLAVLRKLLVRPHRKVASPSTTA